MKQFIRLLCILVLSSLILIGSGGVTIGRMICLGSGYISYSIGNAKDCCGEKSPCSEKLSTSCCDLKNVSFELSEFSISEKIKISVSEFCSFLLPQTCFSQPSFVIPHLSLTPDISPPSSKEYLHFISSLRI